jgi:Flp pilus assembly protein TadD
MGISIEETYLNYGVSSDLAEKYSSLRLPVSTFRALSSDKLVEFYGIQKGEIKLTKQLISRKPIEDEVVIRLLQNCNFVCCCCKKNESGFIIHHIEEYSNSQDNSYDNLIVLCPNHHDLAHRNNGLTMKLSAEKLKQAKAEWENEVKKHNQDRASWTNDSSDLARARQIFKENIDFNILLLRFERLENDMGRKIEETICRRLLQMIEEENLNVSIFFNKEIEIPKTFEEGRSIGKKLNADLVIWGEVYDESRKGELMYSVTSSMDLPIAPNRRTGIQSISSMSEIKEGYLQGDIDFIIYWALAIRALYQNNPGAIIEYALKALEYDELNLSCHYLLGQGLHFEEQFEYSIDTFKLCIELGADGADIYNNLGLSYLMANHLSDAAESFGKAYDKEPLSDIVLHNIGLLYARQEDYDKAIDFLNRSMELNNDESSLWNSLGGIYYAQGEIEKAIEVYLKGLSINPDDYTILNGLGICYMQMKKYNIAEEYFKDAISKNYKLCVPYNNLGLLKREEGKLEEAVDYFRV